ncbi:hypothetical protein AAVH_16857 [Aphelenchoides avenae]|nr:hypothetical protein AAVH_16857 [Aphelenchus avenae]
MSVSSSLAVNAVFSGLHPVFLNAAAEDLFDLFGGCTLGHVKEHAGHYGNVAGVWSIRLQHDSGVSQAVYAVAFDSPVDAMDYAVAVDGDDENWVVASLHLPASFGTPLSVWKWQL